MSACDFFVPPRKVVKFSDPKNQPESTEITGPVLVNWIFLITGSTSALKPALTDALFI